MSQRPLAPRPIPWGPSHPYIRHLRVPFNLILSPIYLWGVLLAGGSLWSPAFWLGYLSLHLFLYGGTTAFNSYYDRDEGPIGGMAEPPPVDEGLLRFSILVQAAGLPLAWLVGPTFTGAWLLICFILGAYSYPGIRFKANPWAALGAVALGQGAVGFALGWLVAQPTVATLATPTALLGMATTALVVTGLYIVTQIYQTAEDRARGDRTLPVLVGPRVALRLAFGILALGGGSIVLGLGGRFGWGWAAALALLFSGAGLVLLRWAARFDEAAVMANYRLAMRFAATTSAALSLFLLVHLR